MHVCSEEPLNAEELSEVDLLLLGECQFKYALTGVTECF